MLSRRVFGALRGSVCGFGVRRGLSSVFSAPTDDVSIPKVSVPEYLLERASAFHGRDAFVDGVSGERVSFGAMAHRIRSTAERLVGLGLGGGDTVALFLSNSPHYPVAFQGVLAAGGTVSPMNVQYTAEEAAHQLKDSNARFLVTEAAFRQVAQAAAASAGCVERVLVLGEEGSPVALEGGEDAGELETQAAVEACKAILREQVPQFDALTHVAALPYSSGTTGKPKGVMLSHGNLVANVAQLSAHAEHNLDLLGEDRVLGLLPFSHIYAMTVICACPIREGATVVTLPSFDPATFLAAMQTHRLSWIPLVPPLVLFLAKHPAAANADLSSVRVIFSGAAPLSKELQEAAAARVGGASVRQGYGMSEASPVTHWTRPFDVKPGSVGTLAPRCQARIVDPQSLQDLPLGQEGELLVRGPNIMLGYLNNPSATEETFVGDGWMRTGDLVSADEDGHFYVADRLKELIKVSGFQVAPGELEAILLQHDGVADAAVIPVPHERKGEVPRAYVVRAPGEAGEAVTEDDLRAHFEQHLAAYKQLDGGVVFIEAIPKSPSGKILRRILRDQALQEFQ